MEFGLDFTICNMKESHIKQIADIEKANFSEPWSEKSIFESSQKNTKFFVAVERNDNVIGYVGLNFVLDEGYITSVCVKEDFRSKGIATALFNKCFSFAKEKGLSFISLEVRKSNINAVNLYNKLDFQKEGIRKNFYSYPKEDAIILTRRF